MKCELAQQEIAFAIYGELPDDAAHALEQHLLTCNRCQEEYESARALHLAMSLIPMEEPSANFVARARIRLAESLDAMPSIGWFLRAWQIGTSGLATLRRAPIAASALLLLGAAGGGALTYRFARAPLAAPVIATVAALPAPFEIANVSSIQRDPNSENVEVRYNRLVPEIMRGTLDDPNIRLLLLAGAHSQVDAGVQSNSVSLLADECLAGHKCEDGPVRKALMVALRYDGSSQVRLKALNGLQHYIGEDMRVRDAVLEALVSDPDPDIRSRAITLLQPVQADSSVRAVLNTVALEDINPHIRTVSREVLDQLPEVQ